MEYRIENNEYQIFMRFENVNLKDFIKIQEIFHKHSEYTSEWEEFGYDNNFRTDNNIFECEENSFSMYISDLFNSKTYKWDNDNSKIILKYFEENFAL